MSNWIDFKALRQSLKFADVLRHYGVEVKAKGNQHHGFCPIPTHQGKRNSPSFSANLEKGIFQCFGCGAKGNILEFAVLMEQVNPADGSELRKVAMKLQERFGAEAHNVWHRPLPRKKEAPEPRVPVIVNAPLDFELKGLDESHPYLHGRGLSAETIAHFGIGFCSRGSLKGRIAIPLHDHDGKLIGYAGRVIDDATIDENNPRYRFPSKRERSGTMYEFHKTLFVYNGWRFKEPMDDLIVVEGFTSVWWLHQHGYQNVVATMGADCSERQLEIIVSLVKDGGRIWFMPDGDEAGTRFARVFVPEATQHRFLRWLKLDAGKQATDYDGERLDSFFRA